jgi:hypothetical protein
MTEAYRTAIKNCSNAIKTKATKRDAFEFSTVLAIAFGKSKITTLDDLMENLTT